jgi:RNA polymerase sigma factor (sigma-70 family)
MHNQDACALRWETPMNGERTATIDDDSHAVTRFLRGESAAFDGLFAKYQDYVYYIVYGIVGSAEEARDLTQDVFVQVYRSLPRFRRGARFATWLYRIAVNRAVDAARSSRRWRFLPILDVPSIAEQEADVELEPESAYLQQENRDMVQQILMKCPLNHRDVLVLRYYRGLSVEEIAETLSCSVSAAKVRLHRARRVFKEFYVAASGADSARCNLEGAQNDAG